MEIKIGQTAVTGYVGGVWSKEDNGFIVKRGMSKAGNKYQIFDIKVSNKKEDGSYENGKGVKVMLMGDTKIEVGDAVGIIGNFKPDNYTNQDGKEIRGNILMANETFTPASWEKKDTVAEANTEDKLPW